MASRNLQGDIIHKIDGVLYLADDLELCGVQGGYYEICRRDTQAVVGTSTVPIEGVEVTNEVPSQTRTFALVPHAQPAGVGAGGVIVAVSLPTGVDTMHLKRIVVAHVSGPCDSYAVEVSTDPNVADPLQRVVGYEGRPNLSRVDDDNGGNGFAHDVDSTLYVKLTPDAGLNGFAITLYGGIV